MAAAYEAAVAWLDTYALRLFANEQQRRAELEAEDPDMRMYLPPADALVQQHAALATSSRAAVAAAIAPRFPRRW